MKSRLSKLDKPLLISSLVLFIFGLIMILSASSMESFMRYNYSPYHYFFREAIFLTVGFIAFIFTLLFPTKNYKRIHKILLIGGIIALAGLLIYGHAANNAASWYKIGPFTIQPSEFVKIILIIYMGVYYNQNKKNMDNQWTIIKPILFAVVIVALIAIEPDLGTGIIIMLITLMMFYAVPISKKNRSIFNKIFVGGTLIVILILLTAGSKVLKSYQLERFNFIDPCERYQEESGYQLCNSLIAFKNGGLTGKGLGNSTQKYLYLPESYTDFIFAIIVEEWGLIVGIVILLIYLLILFRIVKIARNANNLQNSLIAYGIFCYILIHIAINLLGIMGLMPLTGVPLPFLSYGGSYAICMMTAMGLVQRVAIESKKENNE